MNACCTVGSIEVGKNMGGHMSFDLPRLPDNAAAALC